MDYREHDRATAAISHLPHVIAYTLVNLVKHSDSPEGTMRQLAAGGFRDITRIASSSPDMWQQICEENRFALADRQNRQWKSRRRQYLSCPASMATHTLCNTPYPRN